MNRKPVLIRTLNVFNGNFGGVMQAYALQNALDSMGFEAWTDTSYPVGAAGRARRFVKPLLPKLLPASLVPTRLGAETVNAELDDFARRHLKLIDLYGGRRVPRDSRIDQFEAFVVGSDQVWRQAYADIPSFMLDFVGDRRVPRVAYAASFGTDGLDGYTPELVMQSRDLAQKFSAISVREDSGVSLCRDRLGVSAQHVLDPTMLLTAQHYQALIQDRLLPGRAAPFVYDFTLDSSAEKREVVKAVARMTGATIRSALPPEATSFQDVRRQPDLYRKPPVEEWLRGFADAEAVVTDSYHGTVFSILFQKPFLAIVNPMRGSARFGSLLRTFELQDHLVELGQPISFPPAYDRTAVSARLELWRARSWDFLRSALEPGH